MEHTPTCATCGRLVQSDWTFCPGCGNPPELLVPTEQLKLFSMQKPDGHMESRYGPERVFDQLYREGGYATPEEAKQAWFRDGTEKRG